MIAPIRRRVWALSLAAAVAACAAGRAEAASVATPTTYTYSTVGTVDSPMPAGTPALVYYNGMGNAKITPPDSIDLGQFVVSALSKTTNATYANAPFQIIASVGGDASDKITGVINGSVGPGVTTPALTATFTGVSQYGNNKLPFMLNLPLNSPMPLALSDGSMPAPTALTGPAVLPAPVPEPASVAVFAVALGGLGLWGRRRVAGR